MVQNQPSLFLQILRISGSYCLLSHLQLAKTLPFIKKNSWCLSFIGSNGAADAPDLPNSGMTIDSVAFQVSVPYYVENALFLLKHYKK